MIYDRWFAASLVCLWWFLGTSFGQDGGGNNPGCKLGRGVFDMLFWRISLVGDGIREKDEMFHIGRGGGSTNLDSVGFGMGNEGGGLLASDLRLCMESRLG